MFICGCGHHRCKRLVSRSTWYRHKLAAILRNPIAVDDTAVTEPLPVEEATHQEEHPVDPAHDEVKILTYLRISYYFPRYPNIS